MENQDNATMNTIDILESDMDPFKTLGLPFAASLSEIRQSWERLPDEKRQNEEYIRAYKMIGSPEGREIYLLLSPSSPGDLETLSRDIPRKPRYSGPGIWYRTLEGWLENEDNERESPA